MAKKQAKGQSAKPNHTSTMPFISAICIAVGGSLFALIAISYFILQVIIADFGQMEQDKLHKHQAEQIRNHINNFFSQLDYQLNRIIQNSEITAALAAKNQGVIKQKQSEISQYFPHTIAVRILAKGAAAVDQSLDPPMNFQQLDMVRRIEKTGTIAPEAMRYKDQWIINYMHSVKDANQQVLASISSYFDLSTIKQELSGFELTAGRIQIFQSGNQGAGQSFLSYGQQLNSDKESIKLGLAIAHWQLYYYPSDNSAKILFKQLIKPLLGAALLIIVSISGAFVTLRKQQAKLKLRQEAGKIVAKIVQDTGDGAAASSQPTASTKLPNIKVCENTAQEQQHKPLV